MEKMQSVYKDNPKLGDPNSLGQSLEQTSQKISALVDERDKFQVCVYIYTLYMYILYTVPAVLDSAHTDPVGMWKLTVQYYMFMYTQYAF